ncbi:MAG: glycine cleavage system protein GcvH [Sedimentisphaerales bacterium]|nr:glycine cleavage system protein GcvH [Sedimentisphaerales bacterium]
MIKDDLLYTRDHEWVRIDGDQAIVGITDHAQEQLGELTYVELPDVDKQVQAHDVLGVLESSKAASDVYAPVAGTVTEVNSKLEEVPDLINNDCYEDGWICKLEISDPAAGKSLLNAEEYEEYLRGLET